MAERGTVMGDLRCGLRHRLGDNALVGRGVSPDRRSPVRGGESRAAEGDAGDGRDHHLLNCVLVHVAPSLSVFRRAPLRRH